MLILDDLYRLYKENELELNVFGVFCIECYLALFTLAWLMGYV